MITSLGPSVIRRWYFSDGDRGRIVGAVLRALVGVAFHLQDLRLDLDAVTVVVQGAGRIDDPMAGKEQGDGVTGHGLPDRAGRLGMPDFARDPAVGSDLARRDLRGHAKR